MLNMTYLAHSDFLSIILLIIISGYFYHIFIAFVFVKPLQTGASLPIFYKIPLFDLLAQRKSKHR